MISLSVYCSSRFVSFAYASTQCSQSILSFGDYWVLYDNELGSAT